MWVSNQPNTSSLFVADDSVRSLSAINIVMICWKRHSRTVKKPWEQTIFARANAMTRSMIISRLAWSEGRL